MTTIVVQEALRQGTTFGHHSNVSLGSMLNTSERIAASTSRKAVTAAGHWFWGLPVVASALAVISLWDHHIEKKRIAHEYDVEIGARLGKPPQDVTVDDMEKVARENPTINEALKRSTKQRNLSIGTMVVGTAAAFGIAALLIHAAPIMALAETLVGALHLGGAAVAAMGAFHIGAGITATAASAGIAHMLVTGVGAGLAFFGVERQLEKWGEKKFKLKEPELDDVRRNPMLQSKLSVPSQITYLGQLQAEGRKISQEQVMGVFASANQELSSQIEARYGTKFAELSASVQTQAVQQLGGEFAIAELTQDINNRHMRVQEIAFTAHGQSSGVEGVGDMVRENAQMQQRIEQLNAQLNQLYSQPRQARVVVVEQETQQNGEWQRRILAQRQLAAKAAGVGA